MSETGKPKAQPKPAAYKYARQPLTVGASVIVILLIIVLATTSNEIYEIAYAVQKNQSVPWKELLQRDLAQRKQASDFAVWLATVELNITKQIFGADHLGTAASENSLAALYLSRGQFSQAESLLQSSLSIREQKLGINHPFVAESLSNLAYVEALQKKLAEAAANLKKCAEIQEALPGLRKDRWTTLANAGYLLLEANRTAEAEALMKDSLQEVAKQESPNSLNYAFALHNLANVYLAEKNLVQAEQLVKTSQPLLETHLGENSEYVISALSVLAYIEESLGKNADAEKYLVRSIELRKRTSDRNDPRIAVDLSKLAFLLLKNKNPNAALRAEDECIRITKEIPDDSDANLTKLVLLKQSALFLKQQHDPRATAVQQQLDQLSSKTKSKD